MPLLDPTTRTILKHVLASFLLGAVVLVAAFTMDYCADLARDWHRSPTVIFGCRLLANWLFILDLVIIIGSATIGGLRILRKLF